MMKLSRASSTSVTQKSSEGCGFISITLHSHGHHESGASVRYRFMGRRMSRASRNHTGGGREGGREGGRVVSFIVYVHYT